MISIKDYEFWFIVGSQDLYGEETLKKVAGHSKIMVDQLNKSANLPCKLILKPTVITPDSI